MNLKCLILMFVGIWQMTLFAAFTPEEARRVYGESSSSLNLSTFKEVGDYVFMEVKWSVDKDVSSDDRESLEMSALMDAIQKYVEPPVIACTNSPFLKALTTWLTACASVLVSICLRISIKANNHCLC